MLEKPLQGLLPKFKKIIMGRKFILTESQVKRLFENMEKRRLNEKDLNKIVKKVLQEGSTWEGVKGWLKGKGYNYSKYLFEIDETLSEIRSKIIEDSKFMSKLTEIEKNLNKSSADQWQKEDLSELMVEIVDTMDKTNKKLEKLASKIKRMK
jgi:hypothetical protein